LDANSSRLRPETPPNSSRCRPNLPPGSIISSKRCAPAPLARRSRRSSISILDDLVAVEPPRGYGRDWKLPPHCTSTAPGTLDRHPANAKNTHASEATHPGDIIS
jgi:hypothetical protein